MAVALIQKIEEVEATPGSITFVSTPTEGNLLVIGCAHRSADATMALSGSGWTERIAHFVGDATYRRELFVFTKMAGAAEPSTITGTATPSAAVVMHGHEFSGVDEANFVGCYGADNGEPGNPSTEASQVSGTTGTLTLGNYLMISHMYTKDNRADASYSDQTWTNGLDQDEQWTDVNNNSSLGSAWGEKTALSGTFNTTGTYTDSSYSNRGHINVLTVLSLTNTSDVNYHGTRGIMRGTMRGVG